MFLKFPYKSALDGPYVVVDVVAKTVRRVVSDDVITMAEGVTMYRGHKLPVVVRIVDGKIIAYSDLPLDVFFIDFRDNVGTWAISRSMTTLPTNIRDTINAEFGSLWQSMYGMYELTTVVKPEPKIAITVTGKYEIATIAAYLSHNATTFSLEHTVRGTTGERVAHFMVNREDASNVAAAYATLLKTGRLIFHEPE